MRERGERLEPLAGGARGDRLDGEGDPRAEIVRVAGGDERPGCVEDDGVAARPGLPREDAADRVRVVLGGIADELGRGAAWDAELERVDLPLAHLPVGDLGDEVRARRGQLVDAVRAVDDVRPLRAELHEHLPDGRHEVGRVDPHHLGARTGRVRQRPQDVEDGPRRQLAPDWRRVTHGGVVGRGEEEAEPERVDRLLDPRRWELELEAERLEHVGRAGGRRDRPVAVLRHPGTGRRGEQRGRGRDVERPRPVAACARRVDEVCALRVHGENVASHRLGTAGDLVRRLALDPHGDEEGADLRGRGVAAHDLVHDGARLRPA